MTREQLNEKILELEILLEQLPDQRQGPLRELIERTRRLAMANPSSRGLSDEIDDLRLYLKYLAFDIEATRREQQQS